MHLYPVSYPLKMSGNQPSRKQITISKPACTYSALYFYQRTRLAGTSCYDQARRPPERAGRTLRVAAKRLLETGNLVARRGCGKHTGQPELPVRLCEHDHSFIETSSGVLSQKSTRINIAFVAGLRILIIKGYVHYLAA